MTDNMLERLYNLDQDIAEEVSNILIERGKLYNHVEDLERERDNLMNDLERERKITIEPHWFKESACHVAVTIPIFFLFFCYGSESITKQMAYGSLIIVSLFEISMLCWWIRRHFRR